MLVVAGAVTIISSWIVLSKHKINNLAAATLPQIKIGYNIQTVGAAPLMVADHNGYFKDQGIDAKLIQLNGGSEVAVALGSGKIDMGAVNAPRLYNPIEDGLPIKFLSTISKTRHYLLIRSDANISSLKDLEGKSFSSGPGGGNKELFFRNILKNNGVDATKVKFLSIENAYLPLALMKEKAVDAVIIGEGDDIEKYTALGSVIVPNWYENNYQKSLSGTEIATNVKFLNNNEQNIVKFYRAVIEADRFIKNHLDEASTIVTDHIKTGTNGTIILKPENFKKTVMSGGTTYNIWEDPTSVAEIAHIAYDLGQVKKVLSLDDLYDLRFKDMLVAAQNEIYGQTKN
ncbi:MAG: ABC transporter substrate-binding protein [Patescibacteria group bacterium]|nr:ABC transporter substrate-binding protein [Patescibacteria group bacterium]